jgi:hypothetical protein
MSIWFCEKDLGVGRHSVIEVTFLAFFVLLGKWWESQETKPTNDNTT